MIFTKRIVQTTRHPTQSPYPSPFNMAMRRSRMKKELKHSRTKEIRASVSWKLSSLSVFLKASRLEILPKNISPTGGTVIRVYVAEFIRNEATFSRVLTITRTRCPCARSSAERRFLFMKALIPFKWPSNDRYEGH